MQALIPREISTVLLRTDVKGLRKLLAMLQSKAEAKGITELSKETGIPRTHFYRIFSKDGNPRMSSVLTMVDALGLKLELKEK